MLAGEPFSIAQELDPGAVDQELERLSRLPKRDLDGDLLLPPTERRIVGNRPIETCQFEHARDHARGLAQRKFEQDFDRETKLDRRIREQMGTTRTPVRGREPAHVLVEPQQQRSALAKRRVIF